MSEEAVVLPLEEVQINEQLCITEEPTEMLDREIKQLRRNTNCEGSLELKTWTIVYLGARSFYEEQVPPPVYKRISWKWQIVNFGTKFLSTGGKCDNRQFLALSCHTSFFRISGVLHLLDDDDLKDLDEEKVEDKEPEVADVEEEAIKDKASGSDTVTQHCMLFVLSCDLGLRKIRNVSFVLIRVFVRLANCLALLRCSRALQHLTCDSCDFCRAIPAISMQFNRAILAMIVRYLRFIVRYLRRKMTKGWPLAWPTALRCLTFCSIVRFLATGIWASIGNTASHPYTKEYGVCPVDVLGVVRFVHRTEGSSSTHLPFAPFNLLRIELTTTLLLDSASPLD
ncbi:LOW QUALITY PROTEIN: hypothetical protein OSB04_029119 [Centaurea solstitialis]|uniref:Uncharacterized protein n=1 Tax=Centaurea solstitialis TaxID=347529 RepID=A0AA38SPJ3_9ASTR|nr:LOW QUALITY PROTEIN: hypothetical protein OSB04_029119 [Centaurea solstitialis]